MTKKMKTVVRPMGDKVLVKRVDATTKTPGGLFIPGNAQEKPMEATVVAVGPGRRLDDGTVIPVDLQVGDVVILNKFTGAEVNFNGEEHLIITERDVLATSVVIEE